MPTAASLISKVDKILKKYNPIPGTAYKRVVVRLGGDPVTGKGATTIPVDTVFKVPPVIRDASYNDALIRSTSGRSLMTTTGSLATQLTDLVMTVSSTDVSSAELENPNLSIVIFHGSLETEYFIAGFTPATIFGEEVVFDLLIRSKKRA